MDEIEELKPVDGRRDLLDFSKLAKLPKSQQDLITKLSMPELRALRGIFRR